MNAGPLQRVFVGIKVTDEIAKACVKLQADLADLPARFIPPEDIHLTLLPPWEMEDQSLVEEKLRQAVQPVKRFVLRLKRLAYGPDNARPRLAWIECEASGELIKLKRSIFKAFGMAENVSFLPHITIARFSNKNGDLIKLRSIDRPLDLSMPAESVELFASKLGGATGYRVLASAPIPAYI